MGVGVVQYSIVYCRRRRRRCGRQADRQTDRQDRQTDLAHSSTALSFFLLPGFYIRMYGRSFGPPPTTHLLHARLCWLQLKCTCIYYHPYIHTYLHTVLQLFWLGVAQVGSPSRSSTVKHPVPANANPYTTSRPYCRIPVRRRLSHAPVPAQLRTFADLYTFGSSLGSGTTVVHIISQAPPSVLNATAGLCFVQ